MNLRRTSPLCLGLLVACAGADQTPLSTPTDDAGLADVGDVLDAGATPDAGAARDAGVPLDAGEVSDAGSPSDAGAVTDAGTPPQVDLRAWFANYNAGQGTAYLDDTGQVNPAGDPRYPNAPAHVLHADVPYGPFPRNLLDLWQADATTPRPVLVYIHGGGFQAGSKESVHQNPVLIPRLLEAGVSVASISYRYAYRDPDAAIEAPIPNDEGTVHDVNGTRLDYILRDCARAIQYIRHRAAAWNVDPTRIAAIGGSAGAGCATWTGVVDDLAVPDHADPVLRESTRLTAIGHTNGQPTYDWLQWPALLQMDPAFVFSHIESEGVRLTQMTLDDFRNTAEGQQLAQVLDYHGMMGPSDPPFFTANGAPDLAEGDITDSGQVIHHPRGHVALYRRCEAAGLECEIDTQIERSDYPRSVYQYLVERLIR